MPLNTPSKAYQAKSKVWNRCRDVVGGSDAVKAKGQEYLPALESHSALNPALYAVSSMNLAPAAYEAYKQRALFYPAGRRTIMGLTGLLFGHPIVVEGANATLKEQMVDVTLTNVSLESFAANLAKELLEVGRIGVLLDMPEATDPGHSARPYWVPFKTESILSVRTIRINGKAQLSQVVIEEEVDEPDPKDPYIESYTKQWRVLLLRNGVYVVELWRQDGQDKTKFVLFKEVTPLRRGAPLDFIPCVLIGPEGLLLTDIPDPPLVDLFDVNLSHYRTSADQEQGAHFTALPTPYVTGHQLAEGETLSIGAGVCWVFPNPQASAGMVEFSGAGLKSLAELKEEKRQLMATLGARMLETQKSVQEAAETVRLRQAGESSALMVLGSALSLALSVLMRWHVYWSEGGAELEALAKKITVKLNPDILTSLSPEEVKTLVATWQAGVISKRTLYSNLEWGEYTRPGVSFEEEEAEIAAEGDIPELDPAEDQANGKQTLVDPGDAADSGGSEGIPPAAGKAGAKPGGR